MCRNSLYSRRSWLVALATAVFDLDLGQRLDLVHPATALTESEKSAVAYSAFPDSLSLDTRSRSSVRDSTYFFRVRRTAGEGDDSEELRYLYCFAFCRQRQDDRLPRGADQRTSLLISHFPYSSIFTPLVQTLGPTLMAQGLPFAQQIFAESETAWPAPVLGRVIQLPVGPVPISGRVCPDSCLPEKADGGELACDPYNALMRTTTSVNQVASIDDLLRLEDSAPPTAAPRSGFEVSKTPVGVFHEVDVFSPFSTYLDKLWNLWELMLMAQPLMVFARSPNDASNVVAGLVSLITPLPYAADFRPVLTIHDPQVREVQDNVVHAQQHHVPTVFGVTNPFFLRACERCPNVVAVALGGSVGGGSVALGKAKSRSSLLSRLAPAAVFKSLFSRSQGHHGLLEDESEGAWLSYKALGGGPDRAVLKSLRPIPESTSPARAASIAVRNSNTLRIHLFQLTSAFLSPFYHYYRIPLPWSSSPPSVEAEEQSASWSNEVTGFFHVADFIAFLDRQGYPPEVLTYCGSAVRSQLLYIRFVQSLNFVPWLCRILEDAGLGSLLRDAPEASNPGTSSDVHVIDSWARLEQQLQVLASQAESTQAARSPKAPAEGDASLQATQRHSSMPERSRIASAASSKSDAEDGGGHTSPLTFHLPDEAPPGAQRSDAQTSTWSTLFRATPPDLALDESRSMQEGSREFLDQDRAQQPQSLAELRTCMQDMLASMPEDLRFTLLTSPARLELLRKFDIIE